MTTEMGPTDGGELDFWEQAAAQMVRGLVLVLDRMADNSIRFDATTATLSLSGESEYAGDRFLRGKLVAMLGLVTAMITVLPIAFLGSFIGVGGPLVSVLLAAVVVVIALPTFLTLGGVTDLLDKITVLDHTTEPAPDALDDLKERYVDGEIDDDELEAAAAEVWER